MEFLISESQLRTILMEQDESRMTNYMKRLHSFTNNLVGRVFKKYGINAKMLLTWGTSVGGFLLPLDHFIKTGDFNIDEDQRNLILTGIAFIIFFENKRGIGTILKKIKEEGLEDTFKIILNKASDLKSAFVDFLSSANIKVGTLMDTISYSFLIPIITDIQSIITRTSNLKEASIIIAERLVASGVVLLSAEMLSKIIKKIITKIK
jgi:hypothetical protein